jgi:hypothetical protein
MDPKVGSDSYAFPVFSVVISIFCMHTEDSALGAAYHGQRKSASFPEKSATLAGPELHNAFQKATERFQER